MHAHCTNAADVIEVLTEVLPQRAHGRIQVALLIATIIAPGAVFGAVRWYADQRADAIVETFEKTGLIPAPATHVATPAPPLASPHRRGSSRDDEYSRRPWGF